MSRQEIIDLVKVKLEELTPFSEGLVVLSNSDVKPITSYIDKSLDEAIEALYRQLPLRLLIPFKLDGDLSIVNGVGQIQLPENFLKIYAIKLKSWEREINHAITTSDPDYILQANPYTRGKSVNPVVAVNSTAEHKILELYSPINGDTVEKKLYVKLATPEEVPLSLLNHLALMTAVKVYNIIERPDMAKVMESDLKLLIGSE